MSTLDIDLMDPERFGPQAPDPAENLPAVPDELDLEPEPDGLPRRGSACRFCGVRAAADATRVGGKFLLPTEAIMPEGVISSRLVRAGIGQWLTEVTVPTWRVCSACEVLGSDPDPLALLSVALGHPALFPRTPTTLYVAERYEVQPYHAAGGKPTDRGRRTPWENALGTLMDARVLLAELESAGGVPAPVGSGCGICGRSHSPYGWREATWRPPGTASATPARLSLCDGYRVEPGRVMRGTPPLRRRVGCARLLEMPGQAGSLVERIYRAATQDGAESPRPFSVLPADKDRFMAWAHPAFRGTAGTAVRLEPRPPWWHLADVPEAPPSAEDRLAELEKRLAEVAG